MGNYAEQLVKNCPIVQGVPPQNMQVFTSIVGTGVSLRQTDHASVIIQTGAWDPDTAAAVIVYEDTSVVPTVAQRLMFTRYWTNSANPASSELVETACVGTFDLDTANATYVIEIDGDDLTAWQNYDCIRVMIGVAVGLKVNAYVSAMYVLGKTRHGGATMMDATID